jgi:hypothetical protein
MVPLSSRITFVDIDNVSYSGGIENNGWHDELEDYSCFSVNPDNS